MQTFPLMLKNVILFVALAIPGYILVKIKLIKPKESSVLSAILIYIGVPFLVVSSTMNISFNANVVKNLIICFIVSFLFSVVMFLVSHFFVSKKCETKRRGVLRLCMISSNNGFLGIPLAQAVFGNSIIVSYIVIINIITNVLLYTLGIYLITGDKSNISLKKAFLNPLLIAFVLGIILNVTKVNDKIVEIKNYATHLSSMVTPISMIILGMKMGEVKFLSIFTKPKAYYVCAIKLIVMPILSTAVAFALVKLFNIDYLFIVSMFLGFAMPSASMSTVFADRFGGDVEYAVILVLLTTILSVLTIPLLYYLLLLIFPITI